MRYRSKTKVVSLKLTAPELEQLLVLVANGNYISLSAAIRAGMDLLFDKHIHNPKVLGELKSSRYIHRERHGKVRRPTGSALPGALDGNTTKLGRAESKTLAEILDT